MTTGRDPDRIGRYEVVERIGRGGMGTVYRAHDPQIGRFVAIKVLDGNDDDLRARFRQEVRSAGTLTHPNIVTIHDYGEEHGRPFIVMEFVKGRTVGDLLREPESLTLAQKLRLIQQLCSALDYAHGRGVIHRDIKPTNLMVDANGDVRVLDFGIARVGDSQLTRTGVVLGTLMYMAPEQIEGAAADHRADIFSVGAVLYELLSSRPAFTGDTPSRVIRAVLSEQPPALTHICKDLDPDLERIVNTAIQKEPSQRYQSLAQMARDLANVETRPAARTIDRAATMVIDRGGSAQRKPRITMAAIVIVSAIAAAVVALTLMRRPPAPAAEAVRATAAVPAVPVSQPVAAPVPAPVPVPAVTESAVKVVSAPRPKLAKRTPYEEARALLAAAADESSQLKAAGLFQDACDHGELKGCGELARMFETASGVAKDETRAIALYKRMCDADDGGGCNRAGVLYRDGTRRSMADAAPLFERACDLRDRDGCINIAVAYARNMAKPGDDAKAVVYFQRACDNGVPPACDGLGRAYQQGRGVAHDDVAARSFYQKACDAGGMPACGDLAAMLMQGLGGAKDETRAATLFQRACDSGNAVGCNGLGLAYARGDGVARDDARAASYYERACTGGGARGCSNLAFMYATGRGVPKDEARAAELRRRANQLGGGGNASGRGLGGAPSGVVGGVVGGVAGSAGGSTVSPPPPPPPPPPAPIRIGKSMKVPTKTRDVRPVYPPIAQSARVQGVVIIEATIGPTGKVQDAKVLRSIPLLDQAALDAVRQWEFTPTLVDGKPVPVIMTVTVGFSLQ